jgi:hypothetical protein
MADWQANLDELKQQCAQKENQLKFCYKRFEKMQVHQSPAPQKQSVALADLQGHNQPVPVNGQMAMLRCAGACKGEGSPQQDQLDGHLNT